MKVFDEYFYEEIDTENKKMSSSPTKIPTMATTATKATTEKIPINYATNEFQNSINTIISLLSEIKSFKPWFIIIAIAILLIISTKTIIMCKKVYKIHNEQIIRKHSRVSPNI